MQYSYEFIHHKAAQDRGLIFGNTVMLAATGFVEFVRADDDNGIIVMGRLAVDEALCSGSGFAANDTNGMELIDALGLGHQDRHGAKGLAAKIQVQTGHNHAQITFN
jgi:hypothetical protein